MVAGILLTPVPILLIIALKRTNLSKSLINLMHFIIIATAAGYLTGCLIFSPAPFDVDISNPSDILISIAIIFTFSPVLWVTVGYYVVRILKRKRIHKNARIKSENQYIYYRDDLGKISPALIMFASEMNVDIRRAVSSIILKLKLGGFIKYNTDEIVVTDKSTKKLLKSEIMVLDSIKKRKFSCPEFIDAVRKESLENNLVKEHKGSKFQKVMRLIITLLIPLILFLLSYVFDKSLCEHYNICRQPDNAVYVYIGDQQVVDDFIEKYNPPQSDFYYVDYGDRYDTSFIRADRIQYPVVRLGIFLSTLDSLIVLSIIICVFACPIKLAEQIYYFNKGYIRTPEGNELISKAYALKNYLKDYSLIKKRTEEELVLWEYYLVYAVVLDVNTKLKNQVIDKYFSEVVFIQSEYQKMA